KRRRIAARPREGDRSVIVPGAEYLGTACGRRDRGRGALRGHDAAEEVPVRLRDRGEEVVQLPRCREHALAWLLEIVHLEVEPAPHRGRLDEAWCGEGV